MTHVRCSDRTVLEEAVKPEQFISPELAFDHAIIQGHLSREASSDRWIGHFTYVRSEGGFDWFKHRDTREYVKVPHEQS